MNGHKTLLSLFALLVAVFCPSCSREYYAKSLVEFGPANDTNAMNAIRLLLPTNDPSVSLRTVRNTSLYEIGVRDRDPRNAAKRANEIVATVQKGLNADPAGKRFRIVELAEAPAG